MKRSGKFYRKNEKEVMKSLGLKPTINSGSTWIEKEDGQNEYVICQLKSTDANSIRIQKKDLDTLNYNASVVHKIPVFAIQFLQSNEVYLLVSPENLQEVQGLTSGIKPNISKADSLGIDIEVPGMVSQEENDVAKKVVVKSGSRGQKDFRKLQERKYGKQSKSAI